MCDNVNNNPFAGLFSTINDAVSFSSQSETSFDEDRSAKEQMIVIPEKKQDSSINSNISGHNLQEQNLQILIAQIFGLKLQRNVEFDYDKPLVYMDTDSIEQAVFERLLLSNPSAELLKKNLVNVAVDQHTVETKIITYLFGSYCRLQAYEKNSELSNFVTEVRQIIFRNVGTALQEPEFFDGQEIYQDFVNLAIFEEIGLLSSFTTGVVEQLCLDDKSTNQAIIDKSFSPVLDIIQADAAKNNRLIFHPHWFDILNLFANIEPLAQLIIRKSTPKDESGKAYADTLLGALLSISCLPKTHDAPFEFFDKPLQQASTTIEGTIWSTMGNLNERLFKLFHFLLKCSSETRNETLKWIGNCLHTNASRGKIWSSHNEINLGSVLSVSDGFMLNLENVLLKLCQPFCSRPNEPKVLKIDPTYCAANSTNVEESQSRGLHMKGLDVETCLIPTPEGEGRPVAETFGFVTECFFFTHRALDLGFRVIFEKLLRSNQELARIQRLYNDAQTGGSSEVLEVITQRMETGMSKYLSLRASLLCPENLILLANFHTSTASWLMQVILDEFQEGETVRSSYAPKKFKPITFPLPEIVPNTLRCIPEFVVENTVGFLCFCRRLNPNVFEERGQNLLNPILTEIIALMKSPDRLYNPHLRARLAEGLEALLPIVDEQAGQNLPSIGSFHRQQLFISHPHRDQIVTNLLHVFVSIEMTGQSVQFEQKFNYRRPMYIIMAYLWKIEEHRERFKDLAKEVEVNMDAAEPPLFLRFINLLMNDAVFLLDEALSNMAQLKQMLQARDNGDWNKLPPHEREQQAGNLQHIGTIARFDNILGRETIQTLKMLTTEIKSIFCQPTMVDRISSMLNYLLLQLVGPNKKNLKVKVQTDYDFDPANLVLSICEIYINLSESEAFTLAVSQDGRSYSPELFKLAENVLVRIGGVGIVSDLDLFAKKVQEAARQKKEEDEILVDMPDEFLDPIMSTVMIDPVTLPSSRMTVDRQTIARHLLSDQTDPFNRSPLTMDKVKSNVDLKKKIEEWIAERKQKKSSTSSTDE